MANNWQYHADKLKSEVGRTEKWLLENINLLPVYVVGSISRGLYHEKQNIKQLEKWAKESDQNDL